MGLLSLHGWASRNFRGVLCCRVILPFEGEKVINAACVPCAEEMKLKGIYSDSNVIVTNIQDRKNSGERKVKL